MKSHSRFILAAKEHFWEPMATKLSPSEETPGKETKPVMTWKELLLCQPNLSYHLFDECVRRHTDGYAASTKALFSILIWPPCTTHWKLNSHSKTVSFIFDSTKKGPHIWTVREEINIFFLRD